MKTQAMNARANDFASLFEFLPIGAYRSSPEGRQLRANPALVRLNGDASEAEHLAAANNIGTEWYVDPARRALFAQLLERDGQVMAFESEVYRHKSRERIWVSENAHVVRDAQGQVLYYEGTVEEVTDRVHAQQALSASRAQLREIMDMVPGMVYRVEVMPDLSRRATFISSGVRALYEIEPDAVLADLDELYRRRHPDDRARVEAEARAAIVARRALASEYRIVLDSGRIKWVQIIGAPAQALDGSETRIGVAFDITERKAAEQALRENSELWKRALESSGDGVWDWHVQAGREYLSPQCKALYGFAENELPDRPDALDERTHPDDLKRMAQDRDAHFAGTTPSYVNEHRVQCKDGSWKWILSRGIVISRDDAGRPLRMVGTHTDITSRKQADELRRERDRATAADQAKSQFLSRVSHELRTPLNAILGFTQLLEMETHAPRQQAWLQQVLSSGRHLLGLMDDILDLSSAQTGQMSMNFERLLLPEVVSEVREMLAAAARASAVSLIDDAAPAELPPVRADRKRLKQVLSNLISNAIKYNRSGGWVRIGASSDAQSVWLQVADSGAGMNAEQLARLFSPFERLGAERGPVAGSGLGLALCRQLVDAMGGEIQVQSTLGTGSIFSVRLPRG